jgi:hypothetical protein
MPLQVDVWQKDGGRKTKEKEFSSLLRGNPLQPGKRLWVADPRSPAYATVSVVTSAAARVPAAAARRAAVRSFMSQPYSRPIRYRI